MLTSGTAFPTLFLAVLMFAFFHQGLWSIVSWLLCIVKDTHLISTFYLCISCFAAQSIKKLSFLKSKFCLLLAPLSQLRWLAVHASAWVLSSSALVHRCDLCSYAQLLSPPLHSVTLHAVVDTSSAALSAHNYSDYSVLCGPICIWGWFVLITWRISPEFWWKLQEICRILVGNNYLYNINYASLLIFYCPL